MIKGLLFDLDGVLADTANYHFLAWKRIANELGIRFTRKDNERLKGVSRRQSFEILLEIGGLQMKETEKEQYCERKNAIYIDYISSMPQDEVLPGVKEFLKDAKDKGYGIALGSASKNSGIILQRLHLTHYFDVTIDGTKVTEAKPDPEVFLRGAQALGLHPEECLVFEDAAAGIEAARRGGMKVVGIGTKEILGGADYFVAGFANRRIDDFVRS